MSNSTSFLGEAFRNALQEAEALDQQGIFPEDLEYLFGGRTPSNVELIQKSLIYYLEHQSAMDPVLRGAMNFLESPHGVAYVKALRESFDGDELNPLSVDLASQILGSSDFNLGTTRFQGLEGFGIGASAGASFFVGVLAGAEIVFDFGDKAEVNPRTWVGGSVKSGVSADAGLELSFWHDKPVSGAIAGWLFDLYIPVPEFPILVFIRFMYIKQREEGATDFTFAGSSFQFPLGIGLPLRKKKEKHPKIVSGFAAKQHAWSRSRRATLDVVNTDGSLTTIAVEENTSLTVTIKNTSDEDVSLAAGSTISLGMPSYFTEDDVTAMSINYSGWTFSNDGKNLTLTLNSSTNWNSGSTMTFEITNVESSNTPPLNQQLQTGFVTMTMTASSLSSPIVLTSELDLVWSNSKATLNWSVTVESDEFTITGDSSGTTEASATPGNTIVQLTTVTDTDQNIWVLGYVYNYNTVGDTAVPEIRAAWWLQDSVKTNKTTFYGEYVSESGDPTTAHYTGISSNPNYIEITPTFGS